MTAKPIRDLWLLENHAFPNALGVD